MPARSCPRWARQRSGRRNRCPETKYHKHANINFQTCKLQNSPQVPTIRVLDIGATSATTVTVKMSGNTEKYSNSLIRSSKSRCQVARISEIPVIHTQQWRIVRPFSAKNGATRVYQTTFPVTHSTSTRRSPLIIITTQARRQSMFPSKSVDHVLPSL